MDRAHKPAAAPQRDDDLITHSGDRIYRAAFAAMQALAANELEWDQFQIAHVVYKIEEILEDSNIPVCHPWKDEDGNICYSMEDRCKYCTHQKK